MNYIQKFMDDNNLVIGTPFKTSISKRLWLTFGDDYFLNLVGHDEYMRECTNFDYILRGLLTGEICITEKMGE